MQVKHVHMIIDRRQLINRSQLANSGSLYYTVSTELESVGEATPNYSNQARIYTTTEILPLCLSSWQAHAHNVVHYDPGTCQVKER